jgi:hypothetical protein
MPTRGSGDVSTAAEARAALHAAVQQLTEAEGVVAAEQELRRVLEQLAEQQPAACSAATAAPAKQGRDGVPLSHGPLSGSEEAANTGKPGDAAAVSQEEEEEERLPVAPETSLCDVRPDLPLSAAAVARYSRQLLLPCFGMACQLRLRAASALVVGAGGLGSPVIAYLAGAGIGRLGVVDGDVVEVRHPAVMLHLPLVPPASPARVTCPSAWMCARRWCREDMWACCVHAFVGAVRCGGAPPLSLSLSLSLCVSASR